MPRAEAGTPKALANKMKSKGLQKLRWFCQMCQKQCRDENGFKCHTMSESHQRQMLLFADNSHKYLDNFSQEFQDNFMKHLKRRFGTRRVFANIVYNEYIADKLHLHMNATKWETLTSFIKHLGREGLCVVDETPKGWYITYIDRDPRTIAKQEAIAKKERMQITDEERTQLMIEEQIRRAKEMEGEEVVKEPEFTELQRTDENEKITLSLNKTDTLKPKAPVKNALAAAANGGAKETNGSGSGGEGKGVKRPNEKSDRPLSALEKLMAEERAKKAKREETNNNNNNNKTKKDYWLHGHIIVKVIAKKLAGGRYYKQKGEVIAVHDKYVAEVEMLQGGDILKIDQMDLETVIPNVGGRVLVVNGPYEGCTGTLESVDMDNFCATVRVDSGREKGRVLEKLPYEDFCKYAK